MHDFLAWLEASALGDLMRHSGVWTYAIVNLFHILAIASLFGSVLVLDLRLLGMVRRIPLAPLAGTVVPISATALAAAILTGIALFATKATEYEGNPFLLIKFPAIGFAILNVFILSRTHAWRALRRRDLSAREESQLAVFGGVSLVSWLTAIAAGRLIAYW